jgi:hypothetical protein
MASSSTDSPGPPAFVVVKGYHCGSKWFAQAFNALPGGAFFFEYEHCLRSIGRAQSSRPKPDAGLAVAASHPELASPHLTLNYLRSGCRCADDCHGCSENSTRRPRQQLSPSARPTAPCLATGVSFGALGPAYVAHVRTMLHLLPRVTIVAHVRSNHIKHALSFLRTTCGGEVNHLRADGRADHGRRRLAPVVAVASGERPPARRLAVPPPLLLLRASHAALDQQRVLDTAGSLAGVRGVARVLVYEALQRDLHTEMLALLEAIGVSAAAARGAAARGDGGGDRVGAGGGAGSRGGGGARDDASGHVGGGGAAAAAVPSTASDLVKAGADSLADGLSNYGAVAAYLRGLPCLTEMLRASGPVPFGLGACAAELSGLPAAVQQEMAQAKASRPRGWALNESECGG